MKTIILDFSFLSKPLSIAIILLVTALIGYFNQTDIYEKINALPENRTELDPIKSVSLKQLSDTNWFEYEVKVQCALDVTFDNLLRSMKLKIENKFFNQYISLKTNKTEAEKTGTIKGSVYIHFYGKLLVSLMYMYEPLYEKEYNVRMVSFIPTNTLIKTEDNDTMNHHSLSCICVNKFSIHLFSQEEIIAKTPFKSLGNSEFSFTPTIFYNYNDFIKRNPTTEVIKNGNLFVANAKEENDWTKNIINPINKFSKSNNRNLTNYVILRTPEEPVMMGPEDKLRIKYLSAKNPYCFANVELYYLPPLD